MPELRYSSLRCSGKHLHCFHPLGVESISTINTCPIKGPAKLMWSLVHSYCHGWRGARVGEGHCRWQLVQHWTMFSISESKPGHQRNIWAKVFIRNIPGWPQCSSCSKSSRPGLGTTIRPPHSKHPSSSDSSQRFLKKGRSSGSEQERGQPSCRWHRTQERSRSWFVQVLMWDELTGDLSMFSIAKMVSAGWAVSDGTSGSGNQLMASALECWSVERYRILIVFIDRQS